MGVITLAVLFVSIALIVFGAILGAVRGRNRSILRIILILLCAVVAFFVKDLLVNILLNTEIDGSTLQKEILSAIVGDNASLSQMAEVFLLIIKALLTLVAFVLAFFVLQVLTWLIVFPICKLFVKKDKTATGEYKNQAGVGAIIGVVQGVLIAIILFAPITGMLIQVDRIITITDQLQFSETSNLDQTLSIADDEIEVNNYVVTYASYNNPTNSPDNGTQVIKEFASSGIAKFYNGVGGWLFDAVASTKDDDGNVISISSAVDTVDLIVTVVSEISEVSNEMDAIDLSSPELVLDSIGDSFINIGEKAKNLGTNGKIVFDKLLDGVKEMAKEELGSETDLSFIDEINFENLDLVSVGNGMKALSSIVATGEVSVEQADDIVNALANNQVVLTMVDGITLCDLSGESEQAFKTAIDNYNLSNEERERLYNLFGI